MTNVNVGEVQTLSPPQASSISTYVDYNIGPDDMFNAYSLLSQQLASTRPVTYPK